MIGGFPKFRDANVGIFFTKPEPELEVTNFGNPRAEPALYL
jgi:hypothetical protein